MKRLMILLPQLKIQGHNINISNAVKFGRKNLGLIGKKNHIGIPTT